MSINSDNKTIALFAAIAMLAFLLIAFQAGQLMWGIVASLAIVMLLMVQISYSRNRIAEEYHLEEFVARVAGASNIIKVPTFFVGIPIFIVFGGMKSKYESVFSVEYAGEEITIIYPGICTVLRNDMIKITGAMMDGEKVGVHGKCIKAYAIENINSDKMKE